MNTYVVTHEDVPNQSVLRVETLREYQARTHDEEQPERPEVISADNLTQAYRLAVRSDASRN